MEWLDPFPDRFRNDDSRLQDRADQKRLPQYCTSQVLTLLRITVKPALFPTLGRTKIRSFRRGIGTSEEVGLSKLFDLSHTIQYGVRNLLYDEVGARVEPHMSVVTFDELHVFQQRGLAEALLCEDGVPIRGHDKSLLGSANKECLFRGGFGLNIHEGHNKLRESPASLGQILTCMTWLQGSRSQC